MSSQADEDDVEEGTAAAQEAEGELQRKDHDVEPVFFHNLPKVLFENLLGSWSISAVLDLSPESWPKLLWRSDCLIMESA